MASKENFFQFIEERKLSAISCFFASVASTLLAIADKFSTAISILAGVCFLCMLINLICEWRESNDTLNEFEKLDKEFLLYQKHTNYICDFIRRFWYDHIIPLNSIKLNKSLIERYEELLRKALHSLTELYCDKNENYEISNGVQERFSFYIKLKDDGELKNKYKCLARGSYDEKLKKEHLKTYEKGIQSKTEEHPFVLRPKNQMIKKYNLELWDEKTNTDRLCELFKQSGLSCSPYTKDFSPNADELNKIYLPENCEELLKSRNLDYYLYHYKELDHHPRDVASMKLRSTVYIAHRLKQTIKQKSWFGAIVYESTHTSSLKRIDTTQLQQDMENFSNIFSPFLALFRYHIDNVQPSIVVGQATNESPLDEKEQLLLKNRVKKNSQRRSLGDLLLIKHRN